MDIIAEKSYAHSRQVDQRLTNSHPVRIIYVGAFIVMPDQYENFEEEQDMSDETPQEGVPPQENDGMDGEEGGEFLNPDNIIETIELDENDGDSEDAVTNDMGDMELQGYGEGGEEMDLKDDADIVFTKHKGSVFCIATDPGTSTLAVTGGEDDRAYVFKLATGEVMFECTGHKDSVTCACFCYDSKYVATGDMSGIIKVWDVESKQEVWSFETSDLEWLEWHTAAHVLLAGSIDGSMWMWKIPNGDTKTFQAHGVPTNIGKILPDGKRCCVGYEDGAVKTYDLKTSKLSHSFTGNSGHAASITSLDCHSNNNLIITGSTDVTAKVISANNGKVLSTYNCASESDEEDNSVEAVGFSKTHSLAATGTLKGTLSIWDINTHQCRLQCKHENGIVRLRWDESTPFIYTCTLDGIVHMWDGRNGQRMAQWYGHQGEILDFDITRDGNTLVTASDDGTARVFTLHSPDR
ncbi:unnamed protein product [Owenia fusiformis]|uniref:Angio-associated migratory cell protein n=1 Tax=Owenia fusiformis TaxID=6347 RepID=A0A8S4P772_OWEFU|nr:unnamed protein product [Owenia fusiformis]